MCKIEKRWLVEYKSCAFHDNNCRAIQHYCNKNDDNKSHGHNIRCHYYGRFGHTTPHCHIRKTEVPKEVMMLVPISFNWIKDLKDLTMVGGQKRNWSFGLLKAFYGCVPTILLYFMNEIGVHPKSHVSNWRSFVLLTSKVWERFVCLSCAVRILIMSRVKDDTPQ